MDRKKNNGDFFSYGLNEATGDSEVDICDPNINMDYEISRSVHDDDNDDAMSCSNDGSAVNEHDQSWGDDDDDDDDEKRLEEDEEEKDVVYGTSYCSEDDDDDDHHHHKKNEKHKKKKCYVSFDLEYESHESMDEMEKNRRFWEACLAS